MSGAAKTAMFESPIPIREIATPEWSKRPKSYVRLLCGVELSAAQQLVEEFSQQSGEAKAHTNGRMTDMEFLYRLFIAFVSDEHGAALFRSDELTDVMKLLFKPVNRCMEAGLAFNGMTEEAASDLRGKSKEVRRTRHG